MKKQIFSINGMHCTSCAMNIDLDLEDMPGVKSAKTSYAKGTTEIEYDPNVADFEKIKTVVQSMGYKIC